MIDQELIDELYHIKNWKCDGDAKMYDAITQVIPIMESVLAGNIQFKVIDTTTGEEVSSNVVDELASDTELMLYDIDQFAVCEDGNIILLDDCGKFIYCNSDRLKMEVLCGEI